MVLSMQHENRQFGAFEEGSSHAAEQKFAKRTTPEAADHQQVGLQIRRRDRQLGHGASRLFRDHA